MKSILWILIIMLLISGCRTASPTPPAENEIHPELKNIPTYPGSTTTWSEGIPGVSQQVEKFQSYSYIANVFKYETLMEFYEDEMSKPEWELLYTSEDRKIKTADLMYAKEKTVAHIQIIPWTANSYLVSVLFYDDPVLEE